MLLLVVVLECIVGLDVVLPPCCRWFVLLFPLRRFDDDSDGDRFAWSWSKMDDEAFCSCWRLLTKSRNSIAPNKLGRAILRPLAVDVVVGTKTASDAPEVAPTRWSELAEREETEFCNESGVGGGLCHPDEFAPPPPPPADPVALLLPFAVAAKAAENVEGLMSEVERDR